MTETKLTFSEPQPTRSDAVKNRALLLETALRLFAEQGVEAVTMSAIAEAAGVGKGTLYRHFENKMELCQALLDEDQRDLQDRSLAHFRQNDQPLENLRWFLGEVLGFVERNRPLLCAGVVLGATLQTPAHWWWRQTIRGLLVQMNAPGDQDYTADVLYILLDIHTLNFLQTARGYSQENIRQHLLDTLDRLIA
jgi:AcrR family transcriptional regulator